jgi:hypothetical protein
MGCVCETECCPAPLLCNNATLRSIHFILSDHEIENIIVCFVLLESGGSDGAGAPGEGPDQLMLRSHL